MERMEVSSLNECRNSACKFHPSCVGSLLLPRKSSIFEKFCYDLQKIRYFKIKDVEKKRVRAFLHDTTDRLYYWFRLTKTLRLVLRYFVID